MQSIEVYLDGVPYAFFLGAEVALLAERLPAELRNKWKRGELTFVDAAGQEVGSGGALSPGQQLYLRQS